jgi:transposase
MSPIGSEKYAFVIGVATHAATHAFALVAGETGAVLDGGEFPTTTAGLARALSWLDQRLDGASALVVVEGTGSYGAIVTERLLASGHEVVEAPHMPAHGRRGQGKTDEIDAVRIARAVLGLAITELRTPRALSTDRSRVAMRVLVVAREQMAGVRTRAVNALNALVRTVDLGIDAAGRSAPDSSARSPAGGIARKTPPLPSAGERRCVWPNEPKISTAIWLQIEATSPSS